MMATGDNRAAILYAHVKALEKLDEAKRDAAADFNERMGLTKNDGFDVNVVKAILKRRRNGVGQTQAFDELLREYEEAIDRAREQPLTERDDDDESDDLPLVSEDAFNAR